MTDVEKIITYLSSLRVGCNSVTLGRNIRDDEVDFFWYSEWGERLYEVLIVLSMQSGNSSTYWL